VRSFAVPSSVFLGGLVALLACSGAEKQDVLSDQVGKATTSSTTSSTSSGSSGSTGTSGTSSTTSSGTAPPGECTQEEEDNDVPGQANDFVGAICGTLLENDDKTDFVRFEIPAGTTSTSISYTGSVRLRFTGPGAVDRELRPGEALELNVGTWLVQVRPEGGTNGSDSLPWQLNVSFE